MAELTLSLISLAVAAALQPTQVVAMIIVLQTRLGAANGLAYLGGMTAFRLALGGTSWVLLSGLEGSIESGGGDFNIFGGALLVVLGVLMVVHALRRGFSAPSEDQAAASWLEKLETISPPQAFVVGLAFLALDPRDWIIDISAVNLIAEADLSNTRSLLVYLAYIMLAQSLLWIPIVLTWVIPDRARRGLARLSAWTRDHETGIEVATATIFGLLFLVIGLEHLGVL